MNYDLIYCDPPWEYGNRISNGAACNHYSTLSIEDLKRLPVWSLAADNAVLAMWYTGTHNREAVELAESWGFRVRTMKGFTWVKLNQNAADRFNKALNAGELVDFNDLLEMLDRETRMNGGNHTRIELFAREEWKGWDRWGNQCNNSIEIITGLIKEVNHAA